MNYPFAYTVKCYTPSDEFNPQGEYWFSHGVGIAESYSDAADKLERHFGDELIEINHLELFAECDIIPLPKTAIEAYKKADFPDLDFSEKCE